MNINIEEIIVMGLACFRLTSLVCYEVGPLRLFTRLRGLVGVEHFKDGTPLGYPDNFFGNLLSCMWCFSVWVALALVIAYIFLPSYTIYFSLWLALSTITIGVNEWVVAKG